MNFYLSFCRYICGSYWQRGSAVFHFLIFQPFTSSDWPAAGQPKNCFYFFARRENERRKENEAVKPVTIKARLKIVASSLLWMACEKHNGESDDRGSLASRLSNKKNSLTNHERDSIVINCRLIAQFESPVKFKKRAEPFTFFFFFWF